jgi:hypothetical protein
MQANARYLIITLLLFGISHAFANTHQSPAERKYKPGEHDRYRMTTDVVHNGKWQSTIIAICELQVKKDSKGIPYDEVHWISKKEITEKDTSDKSDEAKKVTPYRISLHPKGELNLPKLDIADMTGEITDFNTFFVAISPKLGIDKLKKEGDIYHQKDPVKGDFANGKDITLGNDCLSVVVMLTDDTKDNILFQTHFTPPKDTCLQYLTNDMRQPVITDTINNFQMVRPFANNRVNVLYGREHFIIKSTVRKKDGKLTQATMTNHLALTIRLACDDRYANCQGNMPFTIYRTLKLELLKD